ncbi:hypothetical protein H7X46_07905 [Pseudonocardia sp. C8]|uniref:HD domain-containing protein n=1 Tax=Pseudonocardia sp. C8 TaxID=2762759 RepID=UPI0016432AA3|nr:HD domain-containing protein [Pseudonocardia sp. C8]MBC3190984.1 hypothetical protein [Pseudonocardia sp. C8]
MRAGSARDLARRHLAGALPRRWRHVQGVARRAEAVAGHLGDAEGAVLVAWLHDVGYAPSLAVMGFHPLDGAVALRELGAGERVCGLVLDDVQAALERRGRGEIEA